MVTSFQTALNWSIVLSVLKFLCLTFSVSTPRLPNTRCNPTDCSICAGSVCAYANLVLCSPEGSVETPLPSEVDACSVAVLCRYLVFQIHVVKKET